MDNLEYIEKYIELRPIYKKLAENIAQLIEEVLEINKVNYHIVSYRAKTIDSFSNKVSKPKYDDPLNQLTDLAGIRVIGYVEDDVKLISKLIQELFDIDLENSLDKSQELGVDKVGYKSVHFICKLPSSRVKFPEYKRYKGLKFEIQIRTILQHSWAEIEHDKNYKFSGELPAEIQRRFKLIAGSLEIADREFNRLSREIDAYSKNVKTNTEKGTLEIPINSTSLKQYLKVKFKKAVSKGFLTPDFNNSKGEINAIEELKDYGITTLEELNKILPKDLEKIIIQFKEQGNFIGLIRTILMIDNVDKYFTQSWHWNWGGLAPESEFLLKQFDVDIAKIKNYLKT